MDLRMRSIDCKGHFFHGCPLHANGLMHYEPSPPTWAPMTRAGGAHKGFSLAVPGASPGFAPGWYEGRRWRPPKIVEK